MLVERIEPARVGAKGAGVIKKPLSHDSVVEQAIASVGGSPGELAKQLSKEMGVEISRQRVNGWRNRGVFPKEVIVEVSKITKIPLATLISAKPPDHEPGNIVERAIRALGKGGSPAKLAAEITKRAPKPVTRQMVNGWLVRNQFPIEMCVWVHLVTKIPLEQLIKRRRDGNS